MASRVIQTKPSKCFWMDRDTPYGENSDFVGTHSYRVSVLVFPIENGVKGTFKFANTYSWSNHSYYPIRLFMKKITSNWNDETISYNNLPSTAYYLYKDFPKNESGGRPTTGIPGSLEVENNSKGFLFSCDTYGYVTLKELVFETIVYDPEIADYKITGNSIDSNIVVSWEPTDVKTWTLQILKNNVVVKSYSGTTASSVTIPARTLPSDGEYTFRLIANNATTIKEEKKVTLTRIYPSVNNLSVTGNSIDEAITLNWEQSNVESWVLECLRNGIVEKKYTGTTNTLDILPGALKFADKYTFKLTAKYSTVSLIIETSATLTRIEPKIIAIEPNNVTASKDDIIDVTWVSENQQSFILTVDGNTYKGTTTKKVSIPVGVISSLGKKNISLTINHTSSWGEVRTATKSVSFTAVGKPRTPVLDGYSYYSTSLPEFTWTSLDDYIQYRVQVLKGNVIVDDSGDVIRTDTSYTCQTALENETEYKVQVKVKTQYGYWSDYAVKKFTTNFVVANKPSIEIFTSDNAVIINSFTVYSEAFDHCDIYRKTEYGEWVRIAYNLDNNVSFKDEYVGKEKYHYKVSSVSTSGGIRDSDTATASINIQNFNFANIEDINNGVEFIYKPDVTITDMFESVSNEYAGVFAPISEDGEHNYRTGSCSFVCEKEKYDKFKSIIKDSKVIIYRDCRGEKVFCKIVGKIPRPKFEDGLVQISFNFVEVPFLEKDMYKGDGNQYLVFWDGTYKWDGTISFDGEGTLVNG